jgi:hypothetical protein
MSEEIPATEAAEVESPPEEIIPDPGQLEGLPKKHEPKEGSKRWNEVYHEAKELGREKETWTTEKETLNTTLSEREQEVAELKARLALQEQQKTQPAPAQEPQQPSQEEQDLNSLRLEMQQAMTDHDGEKQAELYLKIEAAKDKLYTAKQAVNPEAISQAVKEKEMEAAESVFKSQYKWFSPQNTDGNTNQDHDPMMAGAFMKVADDLNKTWQGSYPDLLAEAAKRVEDRFTPQQPKMPAVASVNSVRPTTTKKAPELTDLEKTIALNAFGNEPDPFKAYTNYKLQGAQ